MRGGLPCIAGLARQAYTGAALHGKGAFFGVRGSLWKQHPHVLPRKERKA